MISVKERPTKRVSNEGESVTLFLRGHGQVKEMLNG